MSFLRLFTLRAVTPVLAALVVGVVALAWVRGPAAVSAMTAAGSVAQAANSCPLPPAQQVRAAQAWAKMMPVFRHPRCLNCHGGITDPLANPTPTDHMGAAELDSTDTIATCENCHMDGWHVGPDWTAQTDVALCSNMKLRFSSAQFIDHLITDGGHGFIKAAFVGGRGLNPPDPDVTKQPPPATHNQLIQQARDWVAAQGGRFVGDNDCGCVLDKLEVLFHSTLTIVNHGPAKQTSTITGDGSIILKLGQDPSEPDWDATVGPENVTGKVTWSGVSVTGPGGCQYIIQSSPASEFEFWLGVSYQPELKLSLVVLPGLDMHATRVRCPISGGGWTSNDTQTPHIFAAAWMMLHSTLGSTGGLQISTKPGATPTPPAGAIDMNKLMAMDPAKLEAMRETMQKNPNASMAQLGTLMNGLVPNAGPLLAAAQNNFKFAIPDNKWCKLETGTAFLARCEISQTLSNVSDNKGATQTITEKTTITLGRPKP
jgi:hypothetical protein